MVAQLVHDPLIMDSTILIIIITTKPAVVQVYVKHVNGTTTV